MKPVNNFKEDKVGDLGVSDERRVSILRLSFLYTGLEESTWGQSYNIDYKIRLYSLL